MTENKIYSYLETKPEIDETVFLAPGVKIVGDVKIKSGSSIWYNTVIRGDVNFITIGENTNVQDLSMLHVTFEKYPLIIGDDVTIGHSVTLHGCILKNKTFIGMGATILDGAIVESNSMVAAGALVKQGFVVPSGKLVAGVPAKIIRDLTIDEIDNISSSAKRYKKYAELSQKSLS
ncbi:MAG: gamma carbonic anhydrase family protein [Bacteroidetes bacterium]|nr:gamma carbonic anhydrase family protein [Bacteroidota bacterium]MBU1113652.1 gamma carbonic anhydrase family protein [Bacteroidota bacterium]MBU1796772.1 gamma carbonic anhydrase family protein [Bacteroidota bacterium]